MFYLILSCTVAVVKKEHVFFLLLKAWIETDMPSNRKPSKELTVNLGLNEEDRENLKEIQDQSKV